MNSGVVSSASAWLGLAPWPSSHSTTSLWPLTEAACSGVRVVGQAPTVEFTSSPPCGTCHTRHACGLRCTHLDPLHNFFQVTTARGLQKLVRAHEPVGRRANQSDGDVHFFECSYSVKVASKYWKSTC